MQQVPFKRSYMQQTSQHQGQLSSHQQLFVSQDMHNQQDFCNHQAYHNQSDPRS